MKEASTIEIYDALRMTRLAVYEAHSDMIDTFFLLKFRRMRDGQADYLISAGRDNRLKLWKLYGKTMELD